MTGQGCQIDHRKVELPPPSWWYERIDLPPNVAVFVGPRRGRRNPERATNDRSTWRVSLPAVVSAPPVTRTNVYVDGFNLYFGCLKDTPHRWLDLGPCSPRSCPIIRSRLRPANGSP